MRRIAYLMALVIALLSFGPGLALAEPGHFTPGASGIMGASLPPPGTYLKIYNTFVYPGKVMNDSGNKSRDEDVDAYVLTARLINVFDTKLFGADPILDICVPMNYTQAGANDRFALGDTLVQGLLAWHGDGWDAVAGPGIYMPIGSKSNALDPGKDYFSWMIGGGMTHYFLADKSLTFSWLARLEGHIEHTADRTPGYAVHGEFGLGKKVAPNAIIGIAATAYQQITNSRGDRNVGGVVNDFDKDEKYRGFSAGPEVQYVTQSGLAIELRYLWQFETRNGTQGRHFYLNFTKAF